MKKNYLQRFLSKQIFNWNFVLSVVDAENHSMIDI